MGDCVATDICFKKLKRINVYRHLVINKIFQSLNILFFVKQRDMFLKTEHVLTTESTDRRSQEDTNTVFAFLVWSESCSDYFFNCIFTERKLGYHIYENKQKSLVHTTSLLLLAKKEKSN